MEAGRSIMDNKSECAKCAMVVCQSQHSDKGPANCPTKIEASTIQEAQNEYQIPEINVFALNASIQEFECIMNLPEGRTTRNPRVEEIIQFANKMGYKKLGVAFCGGLRNEARILNQILENRGFDVVSVCCKTGGIPKETIGITEEQKIAGPGSW